MFRPNVSPHVSVHETRVFIFLLVGLVCRERAGSHSWECQRLTVIVIEVNKSENSHAHTYKDNSVEGMVTHRHTHRHSYM